MRTLTLKKPRPVLMFLCLSLTACRNSTEPVQSREAVPSREEVSKLLEDYAKRGATYELVTDSSTKQTTIAKPIRMSRSSTTDATLEGLPNLPIPFAVDLGECFVSDDGVMQLKDLTNLTGLFLNNTRMSDVGLRELGGLKKLAKLDISVTQVTDAGMKELRRLPELTMVCIAYTKVTDAGMKELKDLPKLTYVNIEGTTVTDAGLKELKGVKGLTVLRLRGTPITADGLTELNLESLTWLDAGPDMVTDDVLRALTRSGHVYALERHAVREDTLPAKSDAEVALVTLGYTKVTDAGLKELKGLPNLTSLNLEQTQVTDAGLKELKEFKKLTSLRLKGTEVTVGALEELRAALPKCNIIK